MEKNEARQRDDKHFFIWFSFFSTQINQLGKNDETLLELNENKVYYEDEPCHHRCDLFYAN